MLVLTFKTLFWCMRKTSLPLPAMRHRQASWTTIAVTYSRRVPMCMFPWFVADFVLVYEEDLAAPPEPWTTIATSFRRVYMCMFPWFVADFVLVYEEDLAAPRSLETQKGSVDHKRYKFLESLRKAGLHMEEVGLIDLINYILRPNKNVCFGYLKKFGK